MLRMMVLALAIGAPGVALADPFPHAVTGAEVHGDDGTVVGRVTSVQRDSNGRIVSAEIPGLEPADAPLEQLVASNDRRGPTNAMFQRVRQVQQRDSGEADRAR
jgi:hypothetical protein